MLNYNYSVYSFLLLLHSLPSLAIVDPVDYTDPYIFYNGTIAGKFVPNPSTVSSLGCGDNGTYYFSDLASVFKFGVNSPSNNNAFFFEIKHRGDEWTKNCGTPCVIRRSSTDGSSNTLDSFSKRDIYICANPWGCTSDAVYNLYFKSLSVNLSAAAVTRVSGVPISDDDGGPFYVVSGDETTRLNNKTLGEDFNYQKPRNYSSEDRDCTDELVYHWLVPFLMQAIFKGLKVPSGTNNERIGSLSPFTYDISFTNTTSFALFTLTDPAAGNMTISFTGTRGNDSIIALGSPLNYSLPHFTFPNGSEIIWHDGFARASSSSRREMLAWETLWWATLGGIALVLFS